MKSVVYLLKVQSMYRPITCMPIATIPASHHRALALALLQAGIRYSVTDLSTPPCTPPQPTSPHRDSKTSPQGEHDSVDVLTATPPPNVVQAQRAYISSDNQTLQPYCAKQMPYDAIRCHRLEHQSLGPAFKWLLHCSGSATMCLHVIGILLPADKR
jgi:hypothetical protein